MSVFSMFIRETVKISNNEDISRLTTCSFVLLGHVYLMTTTNGKVRSIETQSFGQIESFNSENFGFNLKFFYINKF